MSEAQVRWNELRNITEKIPTAFRREEADDEDIEIFLESQKLRGLKVSGERSTETIIAVLENELTNLQRMILKVDQDASHRSTGVKGTAIALIGNIQSELNELRERSSSEQTERAGLIQRLNSVESKVSNVASITELDRREAERMRESDRRDSDLKRRLEMLESQEKKRSERELEESKEEIKSQRANNWKTSGLIFTIISLVIGVVGLWLKG